MPLFSGSTATFDYLNEVVKKHGKCNVEFCFLLQIYLVYLYVRFGIFIIGRLGNPGIDILSSDARYKPALLCIVSSK